MTEKNLEKMDFNEFYKLWQASYSNQYLPKPEWFEVMKDKYFKKEYDEMWENSMFQSKGYNK
mgnify:CR=1 FL=1